MCHCQRSQSFVRISSCVCSAAQKVHVLQSITAGWYGVLLDDLQLLCYKSLCSQVFLQLWQIARCPCSQSDQRPYKCLCSLTLQQTCPPVGRANVSPLTVQQTCLRPANLLTIWVCLFTQGMTLLVRENHKPASIQAQSSEIQAHLGSSIANIHAAQQGMLLCFKICMKTFGETGPAICTIAHLAPKLSIICNTHADQS